MRTLGLGFGNKISPCPYRPNPDPNPCLCLVCLFRNSTAVDTLGYISSKIELLTSAEFLEIVLSKCIIIIWAGISRWRWETFIPGWESEENKQSDYCYCNTTVITKTFMSFAIFSVHPLQCMVCCSKVALLSCSDLFQFTECKLPASHTDRKQDNVLTCSVRD